MKRSILHDMRKLWRHSRGYNMSRKRAIRMVLKNFLMRITGWGPL